MKKISVWVISMLSVWSATAQENLQWDDTAKNGWPSQFNVAEIPSSVDGHLQKAYLYTSDKATPQPLIVSLHTWSGDYTQADPMAKAVVERGYNYIHPNFRGANNTPQACASPLVLADIEDAIRYAVEVTGADPKQVHIVGTSGGGMATLLAYMNVKYPVNSFSAWVPISNLEDWYWESVGRKRKYAEDIIKSVSHTNQFNAQEARRRSPILQRYRPQLREGAKLFLYTGVHDDIVPITQSIRFYNRMVKELSPKELSALVTPEETLDLLTKRCLPKAEFSQSIGERTVYLQRKSGEISLTVFDGEHEQLPEALELIPIRPMQ